MNPHLDSLIERFRDAQDVGVRTLTEKLQIPRPASGVEWVFLCIEHDLNKQHSLQGVGIYTHGYGVELKISDLTIDFDWGEQGEPDGFDAWRLYNFTLDNGPADTYSYEQIQEWIDQSLAAGELIQSGPLYYDPKRRAETR